MNSKYQTVLKYFVPVKKLNQICRMQPPHGIIPVDCNKKGRVKGLAKLKIEELRIIEFCYC